MSDTQDAIFVERLFSDENNNSVARELIFEKISEFHPNSVIHLGDQIAVGSDDDSWKAIDGFVRKLDELGIGYYPIPGNHEYYPFWRKSIENFVSRYPSAALTGYSKRFANVAIVLFNSNLDELSEDDRQAQLQWYKKTLSEYDSDPSIDFVIVGCHHSPFTNSKIVFGSEGVRQFYLPEFVRSKKCRLFVSGHSHAFEHFRMEGKDFLVIGGGGGLQHLVRIGTKAQYHDLFSSELRLRMFHFLTVKAYNDTLTVDLKLLKDDFQGFEEIPQLVFVSAGHTSGKSEE